MSEPDPVSIDGVELESKGIEIIAVDPDGQNGIYQVLPSDEDPDE